MVGERRCRERWATGSLKLEWHASGIFAKRLFCHFPGRFDGIGWILEHSERGIVPFVETFPDPYETNTGQFYIGIYLEKNLNWKLIFLFLTTRLKRIIFFLSFCQLKWKIKVSIDRLLFHTIWDNNYILYSIISEVMFIKVQSLKYFVYIYHHNCNKLSTIQLLYFFGNLFKAVSLLF